MESAEKPHQDLYKRVNQALQKEGHGQAEVPPSQLKPSLTEELKQIGVDATHIAGSTLEELTTGEKSSTRNRVTSKNPLNLVWERFRRKRAEEKAA